jgi:hypothetical protein
MRSEKAITEKREKQQNKYNNKTNYKRGKHKKLFFIYCRGEKLKPLWGL